VGAVTSIVVYALVASVALVACGWLASGQPRSELTHRVPGPVGWDFSTSWASNFTVVGAILGTTLSAQILPSTTVVLPSPNDYTSLSLLFAVLVVVAPFVYSGLLLTSDASGTQGQCWELLVACSLTLWGVIGELGTVGLVFYEAQHAHELAQGAVVPLWIVLGAAIALTAPYAIRTIKLLVGSPAKGARAFVAAAAASGWSLL